MIEGILLVDKPKGWTSFDVVNKVRRVVAEAEGKKPKHIKVGHCGTLDPFATGLLVILVGKQYTKLATSMSADDKTYQFTARVGQQSTTGDPEGEITDCSADVSQLSREVLEQKFNGWIGSVYQKPPAFSAIKINGERAYELARRGEQVDIPLRQVAIKELSLTSFEPPYFSATTRVSKGTYIRTLVEDICRDMGVCGYTTELRRIASGKFSVEDAMQIDSHTELSVIQDKLFAAPHVSG